MTQVLLFDWTLGGHHELYLERVASSLPIGLVPIVAAPAPAANRIAQLGIRTIDLGDPRPIVDTSQHLKREVTAAGRKETALFLEVIRSIRPDHALHMFADGILRHLIHAKSTLPTRVSLLVFRPRAHYASHYETKMSVREKLLATTHDMLTKCWRRRSDAHALLTLDEGAAFRWAARRGARAIWLPEPPVVANRTVSQVRHGAVLFGTLAPRKGVDRLAAAAAVHGAPLDLTLAGNVIPEFTSELRILAQTIRATGASLHLHPSWLEEHQAIPLLQRARCVVLPYVDHYGMSRVLLEAAYAGTPVVTHNHGLLGYLVRANEIGLAVDTHDPVAFRHAIDRLCHEDEPWSTYHAATFPFAAKYSVRTFSAALAAAFAAGDPEET